MRYGGCRDRGRRYSSFNSRLVTKGGTPCGWGVKAGMVRKSSLVHSAAYVVVGVGLGLGLGLVRVRAVIDRYAM